MRPIHYLAFTVVVGVLASCAAPPQTEQAPSRFGVMEQALDAYYVRRDECIAIHGYDPDNAGDLGPYELAPSERDWADCAYDAVRATLMTETTQPRLYDAAMAEHRTMTDKVASGLMTRAEREARMSEIRDELMEKEIARVSTDSGPEQVPPGVMDLIRSSSYQATRF